MLPSGVGPVLPAVVSVVGQFQAFFSLVPALCRCPLLSVWLLGWLLFSISQRMVSSSSVRRMRMKLGSVGRDAVLESIFDERDEDERGDGRAAVRVDVEGGFYPDAVGEADAHQLDVVAYEVHLLVQRCDSFAGCRRARGAAGGSALARLPVPCRHQRLSARRCCSAC